jgi:DNA topoisomerase IB
MVDLARRANVELASEGVWACSTGVWDAKREDFVAAVEALECPAIRRPVLKIGHTDDRFTPGDGEPAIGWIDNMRVDGAKLIGDYVGVPGWINEIMASAWPDRSIEGRYNHRCQLGHTHPFVLTGVSLLGVTPPGVGTLKSLQDVADLFGVAACADDSGETIVVAMVSAAGNPDALHDYWTKGKGLAKWIGKKHRWTALYRHLRKYIKNPEYAKRTASEWFHEVLGYWPGSKKNRPVKAARFDVAWVDGELVISDDNGEVAVPASDASAVMAAVTDLIAADATGTIQIDGFRVTVAGEDVVTIEDEDDEATVIASDIADAFDSAPVEVAALFDPKQLRDDDGKWTDAGGAVGKAKGAIKDLTGGGPGQGGSKSAPSQRISGMSPATPESLSAVRSRIGKAIPPVWTDVHVANNIDTASLLVVGRDAKGRRQSVYSTEHTKSQAAAKFARVQELNTHLDKLDSAIARDAGDNDSAAALMLIRRLGMRPGSDRDTKAKEQAHGATNLRAKHVTIEDGTARFDFTGKKGVHIQLDTDDPDIVAMLEPRLARRSGDDQLFPDTNEQKTRDYMRSDGGVPPGFLLKDLRTVKANVVALREIAAKGDDLPKTKAEFRRWRLDVARTVSAQLGNTPTLALSSYINPTVFAPWIQGDDWA